MNFRKVYSICYLLKIDGFIDAAARTRNYYNIAGSCIIQNKIKPFILLHPLQEAVEKFALQL